MRCNRLDVASGDKKAYGWRGEEEAEKERWNAGTKERMVRSNLYAFSYKDFLSNGNAGFKRPAFAAKFHGCPIKQGSRFREHFTANRIASNARNSETILSSIDRMRKE